MVTASNGLHGIYLRLQIVSKLLRVTTDTTS